MKKVLCFLVLVGIVFSFSVIAAEKATVEISGFMKIDTYYNTGTMGESAGYVTGDDKEFFMDPKHTRLRVRTSQKADDGSVISGLIETDFASGTGVLRMRHAMFSYEINGKRYFFGQTSDIFSPNVPVSMDRSGHLNIDIGNRRPMIGMSQKKGERTSTFALARPMSSQAATVAGVYVSGEETAIPDFQFNFADSKGMNIGGFFGQRYHSGTNKDYDAYCLNIEANKKLSDGNFIFSVYMGQAMSGYFGGLGYDITPAGQEVETMGGWINYIKNHGKGRMSIIAGMQEADKDVIAAADRKTNQMFLVSFFNKLSNGVELVPSVGYYKTELNNGTKEDAVRVGYSARYSF